ncbi:MAG: isoprenylcysteine carboxylmethyltransferase family protein [Bacteroidetes bacterium]|nr:isoprenylcysteine carboxylmethyltransferase family protein [Bacteroidota bacterium]
MKKFRQLLFTYRGYLPIPFLLIMVVYAQPTFTSYVFGGLVVLSGELLRLWGVAYAGSLTRVTGSVGAPEVIVSGPFAYVRNPLYVGNILTYVGFGIMSNALFPWLTLCAVLWFAFQYYQIVLLEEEFLEKEFGDIYKQYKQSVPRFLISFKRFNHPIQAHQKPNWEEAVRSEHRTFQALIIVWAILTLLWVLR